MREEQIKNMIDASKKEGQTLANLTIEQREQLKMLLKDLKGNKRNDITKDFLNKLNLVGINNPLPLQSKIKVMTDKQIVRLHNRIKYWREFPLCCSESNPYFHNDISIIRTPEFSNFYKKALMDCIIKDWQVKRIDDFTVKFNQVWETADYLIMAENFYRAKAKAPKMRFDDLLNFIN